MDNLNKWEVEQEDQTYRPNSQPIKHAASLFERGEEVQFRRERLKEIFEAMSGKLLSRMEDIYGKLYSFPASTGSLPDPWQEIIDALYRNGCIHTPAIHFDPPFNDEPKMFFAYLSAYLDNDLLESRFYNKQMGGHGASFDFNLAISKSIGEFLERYSLLHWKRYSTRTATLANLRSKRVSFLKPQSLAGVEDKNITDDAPFRWVRGYNAITGKRILLPASAVFWNYCAISGEPVICEANTNGAGGMFTLEGAILSGLRELIQRDAFLIFWLNTIAPPRVKISSLEGKALSVAEKLREYRFDFEILDVTTDIGLPAFVAVLMDGTGDRRSIYIGAGCESDPDSAIARALEESFLVYHIIRRSKALFTLPDPYIPFQTPLGHAERVRLWANPNMFPQFSWFLKGKAASFQEIKKKYYRSGLNDPHKEYVFLLQDFNKRGSGYEIYYYQASHPILDTLGFYSAKVIVPELVPLYLHETNARLSARRYREV